MKKCDICHTPLDFFKFRFAEGVICKDCYKIASNNFTGIIYCKSFSEIAELCNVKEDNSLRNGEFEITSRIGNYILFDDKNRKFCLTNNRMVVKEAQKPEIFSYADVIKCEFFSNPSMPITVFCKAYKNSGEIIKSISIYIYLGSQEVKEIKVIASPVRIKSFAFKRSFTFVNGIMDKFSYIMKNIEPEG